MDKIEYGIPTGLMTIIYVETTASKIIDVLYRKDKHVRHGVGKYMIASLTGAREVVIKDLL